MIEFNTTEFQFSHGHAPRGYGNWAFQIAGETFWHTGKYAEAKKFARAMAVTKKVSIVKVLP